MHLRPDLLDGSTLGQYRIIERLGAGGMGLVYRAHQPLLDRLVAIKVLIPRVETDENLIQRFTREARAVARMEHPNILPIYDFGEHDGTLYIVMPLITGGTLGDRIGAPMPLSHVVHLAT